MRIGVLVDQHLRPLKLVIGNGKVAGFNVNAQETSDVAFLREAAKENFEALALRGHCVSYGQASGILESMNLSEKSGTFSQPVLFHYTADHLQEMAWNVFAAFRNGVIRIEVRHRYPLAAAADAHRDLEARRTSGQVVLLP